MQKPLLACASYDFCMSGLLCNRMVHPMGARGILLKSCCQVMYDIVTAMFVACNLFNVFSACANNWSHKCMGNVLSTPARITWKWSMNVPIAFSVTFLL